MSGQNDLFFNELSAQHGLEDTKVVFVYKDSRGFSWIGTLGSLYRFDGSEVIAYGPAQGVTEPYLQSVMFEDKHSNLWFCTYNKLFCYDRLRDTCLSFGGFQEKDGTEITADYGLIHLEQKFNQLWLTAGAKIFKLDLTQTFSSKKLVFQTIQTNGSKVEGKRFLPMLDEKGSLSGFIEYFLFGSGMKVWNQTSKGQFRSRDFFVVNGDFPSFKVKQVLKNTADKTSYFLCANNEVLKFDLATGDLSPFFTLPTPIRLYFAIYIQPNVLLCNTNDGAYYLNLRNKKFNKIKDWSEQLKTNTISRKNIQESVLDRDGILWGIAFDEGLCFTNPKMVKASFTPLDIKTRHWCVTPTGEYLLGAPGGLYLLDKKQKLSHFPTESITYLYPDPDQKTTWVLHESGLDAFNLKTRKLTSFLVDLTNPWEFFKSSDGTYWLGGSQNVKKLDLLTKRKTDINTYTSKLLGSNAIWEDQTHQRLYLQENGSKIHVLRYQENDWKPERQFDVKGIIGDYLLPRNSDKIWVATIQGIKLIHRTNGTIENLHLPASWPSTNMTGMVQDKQGVIWVSTNSNILSFTAEGKPLRMYGPQEGFFAEPFYSRGMRLMSDQSIAVLGHRGISRFYPNNFSESSPLPKIQLTRLSVQGIPYQKTFPKDSSICEKKRIRLKFRQNSIALHLVGIELSQPKQVKIQYYLQGWEKRIEASIRNQFIEPRYRNLGPGKYSLMVRAANANGDWGPWQNKLSIEIIPPIWMRWWFITLAIIGGIFVVAGAVQIYYRALLREARIRNEEQERILRDIHDLTSGKVVFFQDFQSFADLEIPNVEAKAKALGIAEQALQLFKRISAAVRNNTESDSTLTEFLHQLITESRKNVGSHLEFSARLGSSIPYAWISGTSKKHLRLVIQEALGNVLKHAQASSILFSVEVKEGKLLLQIQDDGKGMPEAQIAQIKPTDRVQDSGNGLGNMLSRMQSIGGDIKWMNKNGTLIIISVSLPKIRPKPKSLHNFTQYFLFKSR